MTVFFAVVDPDGSVRGAGACAEEALPLQQATTPGGSIVPIDEELFRAIDADLEGFRLSDGAVIPRETMAPDVSATSIAADGVAEAVVAGLPQPCRVSIRGVAQWGPETVDDGEVVITSSLPGALEVRVEAPPSYRAWRTVIHAG